MFVTNVNEVITNDALISWVSDPVGGAEFADIMRIIILFDTVLAYANEYFLLSRNC